MPHFLRIKKTALHVPSISNVIMETSCLGRARLQIYYHNPSKPTTLSYSNTEQWWADYKRIKEAMNEVTQLLAPLPLTDPVPSSTVEVKNDIVVEVPKVESS